MLDAHLRDSTFDTDTLWRKLMRYTVVLAVLLAGMLPSLLHAG